MRDRIVLGAGALERLQGLVRRAHDGHVVLSLAERDGLSWVEVNVLLADMGDVPPLHTFLLSPAGVMKPGEPDA